MAIVRTTEALEATILSHARESLDAAGQECARLGHVRKELETNAADGPAAYCPVCLRLKLGGFEGWPGVAW